MAEAEKVELNNLAATIILFVVIAVVIGLAASIMTSFQTSINDATKTTQDASVTSQNFTTNSGTVYLPASKCTKVVTIQVTP